MTQQGAARLHLPWPNHHIEEGFLDLEACAALVAEIDARPSVAAGVHRKGDKYVDDSVRRAEAGLLSPERRDALEARWLAVGQRVAGQFGCSVSQAHDTHSVHYRKGDFFAPHADQSDPEVPEGTLPRLLSIIVFLNEGFGGGILKLYEGNDCAAVPARTGSLVVFRSDLFHEVSPVTSGERYTLVSWLY